jgi:hypothetical protein
MRKKLAKVIWLVVIGVGIILLLQVSGVNASRYAQIPTGSIATVTGSPGSAVVFVLDNEQGFANVRSGPGTVGYDVIGVLVVGQQVPALGRTLVGDWIQISYPGVEGGIGWVWKDLVELRGSVPIVEPPPTVTPRTTPTIDPTLAAQFLVEIPPTRLPTFTPPGPLVIPTFESITAPLSSAGNVPIGFIIVGLAVLGVFGTLISLLRGR